MAPPLSGRFLSDARRQDLVRHEFMLGESRGRLAITLDVLTDALILVGQHGVYCQSARNPNTPALDLQAVLTDLNAAKELVSSVLEGLKREMPREEPPTPRAALDP